MNSMVKCDILLVEDEKSLQDVLILNLELESYNVVLAKDGREALALLQVRKFDIIILDVMLPYFSGFDVCKEIRSKGIKTPVLFLTARGSEEDRIHGLKIGGDDYLVKPFNLDEFLLRVKRILERTMLYENNSSVFSIGDSEVNFDSYSIKRKGQIFSITQKECDILKLFIDKKNKVVSRNDILDNVWGEESFPSNRTVDNIIVNIRKHIEEDSKNPKYLMTIRGVGYKLVL